MTNYYVGIELGTNSIKVLLCTKVDNKYHVISCVDSPSEGIKRGLVIDSRAAVNSLKKAIKSIDEKLGIKITKAIVAIPTNDCKVSISTGAIDLDGEYIGGNHISKIIKKCVDEKITKDEELVVATPIVYKIDEEDNISNPQNMSGDILKAKVLMITSPKKLVYQIIDVCRLSGIEVVDVTYKSVGDYHCVKTNRLDKEVGAIIGIGEDTTNISVFNKGLMIKNKIINVGSKYIDNDLCYIYKIDHKIARKLKEKFVVASADYADYNEICELTTPTGEKIESNQLDLSKVVEARCKEILKIAKNELKNLTNREISYIIITGGVTELAGFQYLVEEILGVKAKVLNMTTTGIRHNKYSSVLGTVKYIDDKLAIRDKSITMLTEEEVNSLLDMKASKENSNIINRVFKHFFEN